MNCNDDTFISSSSSEHTYQLQFDVWFVDFLNVVDCWNKFKNNHQNNSTNDWDRIFKTSVRK